MKKTTHISRTKLLYTFFKASLITFYLGIFSPFTLKAQTVTQSWAALASGAAPRGIAIDASGNVYTANQSNNTVSKITPAGVVTQSWATLASGALPTAIVVDASGNVYTANYGNNTVSKITSAGVVAQSWSLGLGASPVAIAIHAASGNIYTANLSGDDVSRITSAGVVTQSWATLAAGAGPYGIAIDASGNVYTANNGNSTVSKITSAGTVTQSWAALASGALPFGIAIDASGNVYTANNGTDNVSKITSARVVTQSWASVTVVGGAGPYAIAIDASGNVYTGNITSNTVSQITSAGVVTKSWAALASGANPKSIAITSGILYTANLSNNTVSKVTSSVLPVELVSFSGKNTEGVNWLSWETTQEEKVFDFEIERSNDGLMFSKIGISKAKNDHAVYEFIDHKPSNGLNYYRLKINGIDGQSDYSKVIALSNAQTNQVKIYPSVTKGELTIEGAKLFEIVNSIGQIQKVQNEGVGSIQGTQHLNLDLPTGLYIIRGLDTEGVHFSQKIVKR